MSMPSPQEIFRELEKHPKIDAAVLKTIQLFFALGDMNSAIHIQVTIQEDKKREWDDIATFFYKKEGNMVTLSLTLPQILAVLSLPEVTRVDVSSGLRASL